MVPLVAASASRGRWWEPFGRQLRVSSKGRRRRVRQASARGKRMHDENDLAVQGVTMTGAIIFALIWTLLVSNLLFALTG